MEYVDPVWKPWLLHARPNAFDPGIDLLDLAPTVLVKNLLSWVEQAFLGSVLGSVVSNLNAPYASSRILVTGNMPDSVGQGSSGEVIPFDR